jgi:hypothetical protein
MLPKTETTNTPVAAEAAVVVSANHFALRSFLCADRSARRASVSVTVAFATSFSASLFFAAAAAKSASALRVSRAACRAA